MGRRRSSLGCSFLRSTLIVSTAPRSCTRPGFAPGGLRESARERERERERKRKSEREREREREGERERERGMD